MSVQFYRSVSRLVVWVWCAASMYVTTDAQTPGQNINPLALSTGDQEHWGLARGNLRQVGLFHFRGAL
jgi:hypothetical protein